jgi:hypothetical protein
MHLYHHQLIYSIFVKFIYGLFKDTDSNSDYIPLNDGMIWEEWIGKNVEKKQPWPNLRYYPGIYPEELRKTMKNLSQDIWSLNPEPPNMK